MDFKTGVLQEAGGVLSWLPAGLRRRRGGDGGDGELDRPESQSMRSNIDYRQS